ncbi:hypothetical protein [Coleofasciculus sp.]|uniref:hypothetical protein n=1 Tax=Coleofasciculus sp. TaxID=3100458 RepID=UPI003A311453
MSLFPPTYLVQYADDFIVTARDKESLESAQILIQAVHVTPAPFAVIRRPPISRRQLHLCVPSKGGVRRKYGGTVTRHGIRKGDQVIAEKAGKTYIGWCSGDTKAQVSVSDKNWKRLGQFTAKKVQLLQRSTGLIVVPSTELSNLPLLKGSI